MGIQIVTPNKHKTLEMNFIHWSLPPMFLLVQVKKKRKKKEKKKKKRK
jgi:hypothetical protein